MGVVKLFEKVVEEVVSFLQCFFMTKQESFPNLARNSLNYSNLLAAFMQGCHAVYHGPKSLVHQLRCSANIPGKCGKYSTDHLAESSKR